MTYMPKEAFDFKTHTARYIAPHLRELAEKTNCYPTLEDNMTITDWKTILYKMVYAFEIIAKDEDDLIDHRVQEGLDLFAKWYLHLWD